jgi:glucose-1-phosphate adenylyltransferase
MLSGYFVTVVPPQMQRGAEWFQGTADAVRQNLNLIEEHDPDLVIVFGADHVYRMDVNQMIAFHLEREAEISVAALPVPVEEASAFGIIATDSAGRVREFQEKPDKPSPMPNDTSRAYASMGNYIFNAKVLMQALRNAHEQGENDFGKHVLPRLLHDHRLYAYDFATNKVAGVKLFEEANYWRDVGTLDTYFNAHMDLIGMRPRFNLFNPLWPIYSSNYQGPVANIIGGSIHNSILGGGALINGASVRNSVLRREVFLEEDVELEDCIIHDYVRIRRGARLRRTIVGRYKTIPANTRIGSDPETDSRHYYRTASGIVVVPPGDVSTALRAFNGE